MNLYKIGQAFRKQKFLSLVGVLLAVAAATASGYQVHDGKLVERTKDTYVSHEQLLVQNISLFRNQQTHAVGQIDTSAKSIPQNSTINGGTAAQLTAAYAYVLTGDDLRARIQQAVGVDPSRYSLTAARRTSNPGEEENLSIAASSEIPVLEVAVTAHDPELAKRVAAVSGEVFVAYVDAQQDAAGVPQDERVAVSVLNAAKDAAKTSRSPLFTEILVGGGVLVLFIGIILARANARAQAAATSPAGATVDIGGARFRDGSVDVRGADGAASPSSVAASGDA